MHPTIVIKDGRTELWQWDTGRKLQITGDVSETDWIHFRLRSSPNVASVHPYQSGDAMLADIPDDLLQAGRRLIVYVYVADADGNKTTIRKEIAVRPRTKPDDYVYTPTEVKHWTDLEARIKKLEDGGATPEQIGAAVEAYLAANPPVGGSDYTLPVGGNELGGVKNGGNVVINADGTMTAPEASGGGGIAVTGATVGQTVKIAAVDDAGVPTAWEPVDMPSGEKEWKTATYDFSSESVTSVIFELPSKNIKRGKLTISATQTGTTSNGKSGWRLYADVVATISYPDNLYVSGGGDIYTTKRTAYFVWEALTDGFVKVNTIDFGANTVFEKRYPGHVAQNYLYFVLLTDGAAMTGTATLLYSE